MKKDLVDFCQMFLVPASILFAAIGIARTEWLKALISLIGAVVGALWCYRICKWPDLELPDQITAFGLGLIFGGAAAASTIAHLVRALMGISEDQVNLTRQSN
jgi:hypothetical protein